MRSNIPPKGCIPRFTYKFPKNGQTTQPIRSMSPYRNAPMPERTKALEALLTEAQVQERELLEIIKLNPLDGKLMELDRMQHFIRQLNIQIAARDSK